MKRIGRTPHTLSLRLAPNEYNLLREIAEIDEESFASVIREAIRHMATQRGVLRPNLDFDRRPTLVASK